MKTTISHEAAAHAAALNSAAAIPEGRLKGVFEHDGTLWAVTGALYGYGGVRQIWADRLVPFEEWQGRSWTYNVRGMMARKPGESFYRGVEVSFRGKHYVMAGEGVELTVGQPEPTAKPKGRKN